MLSGHDHDQCTTSHNAFNDSVLEVGSLLHFEIANSHHV